jgi:hypothetical protein
MKKTAAAPAASELRRDTGAELAERQEEDELVTLYAAAKSVGVDPVLVFHWVKRGQLVPRASRPRGSRTTWLTTVADVQSMYEEPAHRKAEQAELDHQAAALYESGLTQKEVGRRMGWSGAGARKKALRGGAMPRAQADASAAGLQAARARPHRYRQEHELLTSRELAELCDCSTVTVCRRAAAGCLGAVRHGRIWLFPPTAVTALRDELLGGRERTAAALAAARAEGRARRPKTGVEKPCPCACGRLVYLHAAAVGRRPGYATHACWIRHRWKYGLGGLKHLLASNDAAPAVIHGWVRRWNGALGGRRPGYGEDEAAAVLALHRRQPKLGERELARRNGLGRNQVRSILGR